MADFLPQVNQTLTSGVTPSGSGIGGIVALGPTFRTQQLANSRKVQYVLTHMDSTQTRVVETFIFPISPQQYQIPRRSLINIFETPGQGVNQGVRRIADLYGLTPTLFNVRGTTGFNQYSADNFKKGGTDWMKSLQTFIENWFGQINSGNTPDTMQFFDFFYNEAWWVVPVGPFIIRQTADRPLWMFYELNLAGLTRLTAAQVKTTTQNLAKGLPQAKSDTASLSGTMSKVLSGPAILGPYI